MSKTAKLHKAFDRAVVAARRTKAVQRLDSWMNVVTGLGTGRDNQVFNTFRPDYVLEDEVASNLFRFNDAAYNICTAYPEYAIMKGFAIKVKADHKDRVELATKEQVESDVKGELKRLQAVWKLFKAATWSNVFGAGVVLMGIDDGQQLDQPVNEVSIKKIAHLKVFDKRRVTVKEKYQDPNSEKYDEPEFYEISSLDSSQGLFTVHESRLLVFESTLTDDDTKQDQGYWSDSLLQRCNRALTQFGVSWEMLGHLISKADQGVFKMKDYMEALAQDREELVDKRLELMDMQRSIIRGLVLDAEEEFERHTFDFTGFGKALEFVEHRLSMVSRQPVTVIMGRSPAGENATGESDMELFYSRVESYQKLVVEPQAERLIRYVFLAKEGPFRGQEPDNWKMAYSEIRTQTPTQKADNDAKNGATAVAYINAGVLEKEEVAIARFGPDSDSDISIDLEARIDELNKTPEQKAEDQRRLMEMSGKVESGDPSEKDESGSGTE